METSDRTRETAGNLLRQIEDYLNLASAGTIIFMLMLVAVSVILRRTINRPIAGVYEISELCMVVLVYLGMAYTQRRGKNIRVTVIYDRLSEKTRRRIDAVMMSLSIVFWGLMTWQSSLRAISSWQMQESSIAVVKFPLYPGWTIIPIGTGLLTIQLIAEFWQRITGHVTSDREQR